MRKIIRGFFTMQQMKERFGWWDILIYIVQLAYCCVLGWETYYHLQYAIQVAFYGAAVWGAVHALYNIFSNPITAKEKEIKLLEVREAARDTSCVG